MLGTDGSLVSLNQKEPAILQISSQSNICNNYQQIQTIELPTPIINLNLSKKPEENFHSDVDRLLVKSFVAHFYEDKLGIILRGRPTSHST